MRTIATTLLYTLTFLLFSVSAVQAQDGRITGVVTDEETGNPLPGATVLVVDQGIGAATGSDGRYTLESVPAGAQTVRVTFIGYAPAERVVTVPAGGSVTADFILAASLSELDEVVVTAQQVQRQAKSLGYSVSSVTAEDIVRGRESNLVKALSGRVPGIDITTQSGTVGGGARIILRGIASLGGENQPLFVIDGVPVFNSNIATGDILDGNARIEGSYDTGNRVGQIDPANIKSISVLKGAAAAALYGQRAKNGVILIETKTGADTPQTAVQVTSSILGSRPMVLPTFQNNYGPGDLGKYDLQDTDGWGPHMNGQMVEDFTGALVPLRPVAGNVSDFYETGTALQNSVSFSQSGDAGDFRLGFSFLNQGGIVPESNLERAALNLNAGTRALDNRLEARIGANYVKETSDRIGAQGGNDPNILVSIVNALPRNVSADKLRDNFVNETGDQIPLTQFTNNPYWIVNQNPFTADAERFFGFARVGYDLLEWLTLQGRFGTDIISETRRARSAKGTVGAQDGQFADDFIRERQIDSDISLRFDRPLNDNFSLQGIFGYNVNQTTFERSRNEAQNLNVGGLFNFTNANSNTPTNFFQRRRLLGVYGDVTLGFRDYAFLEVTGRNDWSSTLPTANNSFFYPSVNLSLVVTDWLDEEYDVTLGWLSYGKLRANYAEVGSDEDPYQLSFDFIPNTDAFGQFGANIDFPFNGLTAFEAAETIPPADLKPQRQKSWEVGAELGFFTGRVNLDVTYYNQRTEDQIISLPVPQESGFNALRTNVGTVSNKGVEVALGVSPIVTPTVSWRLDAAFSTNENKVEALAPGLEEFTIDSGFNGLQIRAVPGEEIAIFGVGWLRDPETGRVIINPETGLRQTGEDKNLGALYPDFKLGVTNTLTVGSFDLSFLVDWNQGGHLYSETVRSLRAAGLVEETLANRNGTFVDAEGVIVTRDPATGAITDRRDNDVPVQSMEAFWGAHSGQSIIESGIFPATYVKLREASLTFNLPQRWFGRSPLQRASLTVEGRNLLLLYSEIPHIDPETNLFGAGADVGQGLEFNTLPNTTSFGVSLEFAF